MLGGPLPRTYLTAGTSEPFFLENAIRWADALRGGGADVVMTERAGDHGDPFWEAEFPLMVAWAFPVKQVAVYPVPRCSATMPVDRFRQATSCQPACCISVASPAWSGQPRIDSARYSYATGLEETIRAIRGMAATR